MQASTKEHVLTLQECLRLEDSPEAVLGFDSWAK